MIDPSIALKVQPVQAPDPVAQYGRAVQLRTLLGQQDLQDMQIEDARRAATERTTLSELYKNALGPDGSVERSKFLTGLASSGLGAKIPDALKGFNELDKADRDAKAAGLKLTGDQYRMTAERFGALLQRPDFTDEDVVRTGAELAQSGVMPPDQMRSFLTTLPWGNQQAMRERLRQGVVAAMGAAEQFKATQPKPLMADGGNRVIPGVQDPQTGAFTPAPGSAPIPKAPEGYRVRPDGTLEIDPGYLAGKTQIAAAGRPVTKIDVNTAKTLGATIAEGLGKQLDESLATANAAAGTISRAREIRQLVDSGEILTGPGTEPALMVMRLGRALGVTGAGSDEVLANTRTLMQNLAQGELDAAAQMRGQGAITQPERELLRRAASGEISFTAPELRALSNTLERTASLRIAAHQANVERLRDVEGAAPLIPFYSGPQIPGTVDAASGRKTPAPAPVSGATTAPPIPEWRSVYPSKAAAINDARTAISRGADKAEVQRRLEQSGIKDHGIK